MHYERIALDKATVRHVDQDGRLHVAVSHISKANVCPYRGAEIPDSERLGLKPDQVYQLLRAPEELARGAETFNNIPILSRHIPVTAEKPQKELIVGSTGTDAAFNAPFLDNSLVIWDQDAIDGIENDEQRELSCGYHYRPDMTPGEFDGIKYDGVMRDLRGNHVALVEAGRAGDDVVVMDSKDVPARVNQENHMKTKKIVLTPRASAVKGALVAHLLPKLAQDAKLPEIGDLLVGVGRENWDQKKTGVIATLTRRLKGAKVLAADADLSDVVELLDKLDGGGKDAPEEQNVGIDDEITLRGEESNKPDPEGTNKFAVDADAHERLEALLREKLDPEDFQAAMAMLEPKDGEVVEDETEEEKRKREEREAADRAAKDKAAKDAEMSDRKEAPVMKPAMDKAIADAAKTAREGAIAETVTRMRDIRDAELKVKPWVGELQMAFDSADDVYKFALETFGVETKGVHASAYPAMLAMVPKPGDKPATKSMALDSAAARSFQGRYGDATKRIRVLG